MPLAMSKIAQIQGATVKDGLNALLSVGILALGLRPKVFRQHRHWGALDEREQDRPAERRW
jgi:hypothetical protein